MLVLLCTALAVLGEAQPPTRTGGGGGAPEPGAPPPGGAGALAQALWLYLQGATATPMTPGLPPVAPTEAAPTVTAATPPAGPTAPTLPAAPVAESPPTTPDVPDTSAGDGPPPRRRSRSSAPATAPVAPAATAPKAPATAPPPIDVDAEPKAAPAEKRLLSLDLRYCRVCNEVAYKGKSECLNKDCVPWFCLYVFFIGSFVLLNNLRGSDLLFQDLWKIWHQPQNKRHKTNRGKKRVTWYAETKAAHAAEEDDDEWPWWEPETHTPLWQGGRDWNDWNDNPGSGHASSSSSRSRGRWQWAWVS